MLVSPGIFWLKVRDWNTDRRKEIAGLFSVTYFFSNYFNLPYILSTSYMGKV